MKLWLRHKHLETRKSCRDKNQRGYATKMVLRQGNLVATHNLEREEKAKSQYENLVATQIPGNKKMWSQQESSLLTTKHGHDTAIEIATAT